MQYYFAPMEGITGYIYRNSITGFSPGWTNIFHLLFPREQRRP